MKVTVNHLARVEGDGGIVVEIEGDKVKNVEVTIFEGPRLIESLAVGKSPEENASFTPRICAICSVSHKNASIRASERALSYPEPEKTYLTRELMHTGEIIESNSLHVFALALPDFLGYPSVVAMVDKYEDVVLKALELKKFGNKIMKLLNGKFIHGENATAGGFGKYPEEQELLEIKEEAEGLLPFMLSAADIVGGLEIPDYLEEETVFVCCNPADNKFGFWGDELIFSDGSVIPSSDYKEYILEKTVPYSFAKRSLYKNKPFTVGALARLICIGDRLTGKASEYYKKYRNDRWTKNPFYNNLAQAIELIYALEKIPGLVEKTIELEDPLRQLPGRTEGRGVGTVEAPRGLLVHDYNYKDGLCTDANIITPTAMNLDDIERYIGLAARNLNKQGKDPDYMAFEFEKIARAYDPCISCATHLVKVIKK
ncbi:MAG: Ni/Fe hydrogenase subunit alpha [Chloroflexi bacterium]|nr:Ni/Fe hydrogenase subunit alpha [Chloroflexota bacterium]